MVLQGFKVLDTDSNSIYVNKPRGQVHYKENEWAEPHEGNGPLGVFDSYDAADDFVERIDYGTIYNCEYEPSKCTAFWYLIPSTLNHKVVNRGFTVLPRGTVFADRVKRGAEIE